MNNLIPCNFRFDLFGKFISLELNKRAVLADMKHFFSSVLGTSLFAKKIEYYQDVDGHFSQIDDTRPLIESLTIRTNNTMNFKVNIVEMGA